MHLVHSERLTADRTMQGIRYQSDVDVDDVDAICTGKCVSQYQKYNILSIFICDIFVSELEIVYF